MFYELFYLFHLSISLFIHTETHKYTNTHIPLRPDGALATRPKKGQLVNQIPELQTDHE